MKTKLKILIPFLAFVLNGLAVNAQDIPPPNPDIAINILSGESIVFVFDEIDEYINGILNGGQITTIRIGSIYDWQLHFKADHAMFNGTINPSNTMQLDNIGVVVESFGTNNDDGLNPNIHNNARNFPLALSSIDVLLMTKGKQTNIGYAPRNSFHLRWECGTLTFTTVDFVQLKMALHGWSVSWWEQFQPLSKWQSTICLSIWCDFGVAN